MEKNNKKEKTSTFEEYFKDGVPDWNEREEEFNEDLNDLDKETEEKKDTSSRS